MKVCVLAAGGGTRLHPLTAELPKALLPLPSGQSIIEQLLTRLTAELPVEEIVIAVGYRGDMIRAAIGPEFNRVPVSYAENADWATTPNAESLRRARALLGNAATLLIDGDLVLAPGALRFPAGAGLVLVNDPAVKLDDEAMKIWRNDAGRITALHKGDMPGQSAGEFIGAALWPDISVLVRALDELPAADIHYYEDGINHLLRQGAIRPTLATIDSAAWVEVDTAEDYARAQKLDNDWSPRLLELVTAQIERADWPARVLLVPFSRGLSGKLTPGAAQLAGLLLGLLGLFLLWRNMPVRGMLLVVAAQVFGFAELFPRPPLRLARLARFADRLFDFFTPLLLAGATLPSGHGLLAAGSAIAVLFLYYYSSISYLLIMPRSACLAHPARLAQMNRAWLERGVMLPVDRATLFLLLLLLVALLPPIPALAAFALMAFLLWARQSIRLWTIINA